MAARVALKKTKSISMTNIVVKIAIGKPVIIIVILDHHQETQETLLDLSVLIQEKTLLSITFKTPSSPNSSRLIGRFILLSSESAFLKELKAIF